MQLAQVALCPACAKELGLWLGPVAPPAELPATEALDDRQADELEGDSTMLTRSVSEAAVLCDLLGNPTRSWLLLELVGGPRDTTSLAVAAGCSVATVSHRLTGLRLAGLVDSTAAGKRRVHG